MGSSTPSSLFPVVIEAAALLHAATKPCFLVMFTARCIRTILHTLREFAYHTHFSYSAPLALITVTAEACLDYHQHRRSMGKLLNKLSKRRNPKTPPPTPEQAGPASRSSPNPPQDSDNEIPPAQIDQLVTKLASANTASQGLEKDLDEFIKWASKHSKGEAEGAASVRAALLASTVLGESLVTTRQLMDEVSQELQDFRDGRKTKSNRKSRESSSGSKKDTAPETGTGPQQQPEASSARARVNEDDMPILGKLTVHHGAEHLEDEVRIALARQVRTWGTFGGENWDRKVKSKKLQSCCATRVDPRSKKSEADALRRVQEEFACENCTNGGYFCINARASGELVVLPLKPIDRDRYTCVTEMGFWRRTDVREGQ